MPLASEAWILVKNCGSDSMGARNLSHTRPCSILSCLPDLHKTAMRAEDEPIVTVFHTGLLSRDQDVDAFQRREQKWLDYGGKGFGLVVTRNQTTTDSPLHRSL